MDNLNINRPIALVILDGFGHRINKRGNAIAKAKMPMWNTLCKKYPYTLLRASGEYVGLLPELVGNSEVGHITLGAGRVVDSDLKRFHTMINDGSLLNHPVLNKKLEILKSSGKALHIMGLLSDGGVHSHEEQLYALLSYAQQYGIAKTYLHVFLDGRDVKPQSAHRYLNRLDRTLQSMASATLASIHGRFYAMDRDDNWDRTKKSHDVLVGKTPVISTTWHHALEESYAQGVYDEFFKPMRISEHGYIKQGDGVIFFNLRPDRARQLTECFIAKTSGINRSPTLKFNHNVSFFISAVEYSSNYNNDILLKPLKVENTLPDVLAPWCISTKNNIFIIAESEKYAHVTYFFRGMREIRLPHEIAIIVQSIKAKHYIDNPQMSATEITNQVLSSLAHEKAFFYLINYANADMVGHSGNLGATIKACEFLDLQLAALFHDIVEKRDGTMFITADHGNAEEMVNEETGEILTGHTKNPVPLIIAGKQFEDRKIIPTPDMGLASVAPTILTFLNIPIPEEMQQTIITIV